MQRLLRNRVFLAVDLVGWVLIPFLALGMRLDGFADTRLYLPHLLAFAGIAIVAKTAALGVFRIYRRYWLYASIDELLLIVAAAVAASVVTAAVYLTVGVRVLPAPRLPRSVPLLDGILSLLFMGGTRFAVRAAQRLQRTRVGTPAERVIIIGAGSSGTMIAKELKGNPEAGLDPVGFIDDDCLKCNRTIHGIPVLGGRDVIGVAARDLKVQKAVIAMPTAPGSVVREIRNICDKAELSTKTIPGIPDMISGRVDISSIRNVQIEDLLRRAPVVIDQKAVGELVSGVSVLVTGAGGSIGSEICRQVARLGARELVLLDHAENGIFEIHNELLAEQPAIASKPVIADIRHASRMKAIFGTHRPQVVFHAAAHKHVPLMETNQAEAVTNNIGGTMNVVDAAVGAKVSRFVLISTDKAVNPSSVMGATKLIAEQIVHEAAVGTGLPYVSVRFGNVLASNGSVVPLFKKQIAAGGPVTVTHEDMTRYFMTIPEAVQLVLQAASLGQGGETFVLDMGEPVKIVQLARDLIELSGLDVGKDIEITFTGLRPGEKMFEELLMADEEFAETSHSKVFAVRNGVPPKITHEDVLKLVTSAQAGTLDDTFLSDLLKQNRGGRQPDLGNSACAAVEPNTTVNKSDVDAGEG
ncbi:MAG: polysaccharide biosynthesis protein, partial [Gemmatimonadales bacterium]